MTIKHNRHLSTCVYLSFIAVSDSFKLCVDLYFWCVSNFCSYFATDLHCQLVVYSVTACSTSSAFEIVLMTMDKVIAVKIPHKAKLICTSERAKVLSVINFLSCCVFYLPFLNVTGLIPGTRQCVRFVRKSWYATAYTHTSFVVYPFIPIILLSVLNFLIIRIIWKRRGSDVYEHRSNKNRVEVQLTMMLLLVSVMFLLLILPFEMRELHYQFIGKNNTPEKYAIYIFMFHFTRELYLLNFGINFFLYLLSGSKFRKDLLVLCSRKEGERSSARNSRNSSDPASPDQDISVVSR